MTNLSPLFWPLSEKARRFLMVILLPCVLALSANGYSAVQDLVVTDVSTRAFSVVWASDEPVVSASLRVFSDASGASEITNTLSIQNNSATIPQALTNGIVKITVTGLSPNTTYFFETQTVGVSTTVTEPSSSPFLSVTTMTGTSKVNGSNQLIRNDLIVDSTVALDGVSALPGTLLALEVRGESAYPLTAFVSDTPAGTRAIIDLNNFFGRDGQSLDVVSSMVLKVTQYRGLSVCPALQDHMLSMFKQVPRHTENPVISELETAPACYFADPNCDNQVDIADAQFVLNQLNRALGECAFNGQLDIVVDNAIDIVDAQQILNLLGQPVP